MTEEDRPTLAYGEYRAKVQPDDTDGKPAIVTIETAERRNLAPEGSTATWKICLTFVEIRDAATNNAKELILNSTDYRTVSQMLGADERQWVGKVCVLAPTTTRYEGKTFEKLHVASPERWEKLMQKHRSR